LTSRDTPWTFTSKPARKTRAFSKPAPAAPGFLANHDLD
jgi:hypothetical protein